MEEEILVEVGGKVVSFPAGTPPAEIESALANVQIPAETTPKGLPGLSMIEPAMTMASGAAAQVASGFAGAGRYGYGRLLADETPEQAFRAGVGAIEGTQEALTYQPRTQYGQQGLQTLGKLIEPVAAVQELAGQQLRNVALDRGYSPEMAGVFQSLPAVAEILAGYVLRGELKGDVQFFDKAGQPTPELKSALADIGLDYADLEKIAVQRLPTQAKRNPITGIPDPEGSLLPAQAAQIQAGGTEASLAPLRVGFGGSRAQADPVAIEAMRQWDDDGLIAAVKQANSQTRQQMLQMLNLNKRISQNKRLSMENRPSDITGAAAKRRIDFLVKIMGENRKQLNEIAQKRLPGLEVDREPVLRVFGESLSDLGVEMRATDSGFSPVFVGSQIAENKAAQNAVRTVFRLLSEDVPVDGLRMHNLKRQLDEFLDYRKSIGAGLGDSGKRIIRDVRRALNEQLRQADPEYRAVNDNLSEILTVFDQLDSISGTRTDIFDPSATSKLGREFRKTMSNYAVRDDMNEAIRSLDAVAKKYGAPFEEDIFSLAMFAEALETRFGSTARTSFRGEQEQAAKRAQRAAQISMATQGGSTDGRIMNLAMDAYRKALGISDDKAYLTMEELLKRGR